MAARTNLAAAYCFNGMYDESIVEGKKAIELYPENATAYYALAVASFNKKEYKAAKEYYDIAIVLGYEDDSIFAQAIAVYASAD
jgi:tetratricopeptide (TPR) repeat protein